MKTPPFLLGAALIFWGWQSGLLIAGVIMALILESARFVTLRWDMAETDFRRIWNFCTLLAFTMVIYAFANDEEGGTFLGLFHGSDAFHNATITTVRTASSFLRWLPMIFFLAVASQVFSTGETMPLSAISLYVRRRQQYELKHGLPLTPVRNTNLTYPYFIICLFSAGIHLNAGNMTFFWGEAILIAWVLLPFRSRRFGIVIWALSVLAAVSVGFATQRGIWVLHNSFQNLDARLIARLFRQRTDPEQAITSIGDIGQMKLSGTIVIRVWPKTGESPPTYLREASYRSYEDVRETWFAGSARNEFANVVSETNQTTWLLSSKTNTSSVKIASYLTGRSPQTGNPLGLLPIPIGSSRLEDLHAYVLQKNPEGAVLAEGPGLVMFDAFYGSGATIDSPPEPFSLTNKDFSVPTNEIPALDGVIAGLKISSKDTEGQKLTKVYGFFADNFTYSLWQGKDKLSPTNSPLTQFLLYSRSGHCEYFATATVLLLRELKIPARYTVGYLVHENHGGEYVVRERDAHAWCMYWNAKDKTWENFDTTPASWVGIEDKRASPFQWLSDFFSWLKFEFARFRWSQGNVRQYIVLALIPVLLFLLYRIIFRHGKKRRQSKQGKFEELFSWPGLDSEFYQLEQKLAQRGVPRQSGEPLSDWLERALTDATLADLRAPLKELLQLHYRHRFDPRGLNAEERAQLTHEVKVCLEKLSRRTTG